MKNRMILSALILMVGIFFVASGNLAFAEMNYGYVDVAKVFDDYEKTKQNDEELQKEGQSREQERETMVAEIRQLKDELALMDGDAKEKKREEIQKKVDALQDFDREIRRDLGGRRNKIVQEIFQDIDDTIQRYGERKGLDVVFNERALVYRKDKFDVTEEILTELNKNYKKK